MGRPRRNSKGDRRIVKFAVILCGLLMLTPCTAVWSSANAAVAAMYEEEADGVATPTSAERVKTTGVVLNNGYYDYLVDGVRIETDGWYVLDAVQPMTETADMSLFADASGDRIRCIKVTGGHVEYTYNGSVCYEYDGKNRTVVKSMVMDVQGVTLVIDGKGARAEGLIELGGYSYYCSGGIPVKSRLKKVGNDYYYFCRDGRSMRSDWKVTGNIYYYFNSNGVASKRYFPASYKDSKYADRLLVYKSGEWKNVSDGVSEVNGTYFLFVNGSRYHGTKWYVESESCRYYASGGQVEYRVQSDGIRYICQEQKKGSGWVNSNTLWLPVYNNISMHIGTDGMSDILFYKSNYKRKDYAGTYCVYENGCWNQQHNTVKYVLGKYYYFDSTGKLSKISGWTTISDTSAAYIGNSGNVTKLVEYYNDRGYTIYRTGDMLSDYSHGLHKAVIDRRTVYFYSDSNGICKRNNKILIGDVEYVFDEYGRCFQAEGINWNYDQWMTRVVKKYLGKTGILCSVFVSNALRYAGGSDPTRDVTLKYTSYNSGGLVINSSSMCSAWATGKVTAKAVISENGKWKTSAEYELTADREKFSYDALVPGDVIVYYTSGEPTHVGIYLGKFATAAAVKKYLTGLGVSSSAASAYVHDWGSNSGNKPEYWVLQGGMGASDQVYISNSAYDLSGQYAKKIIHLRH